MINVFICVFLDYLRFDFFDFLERMDDDWRYVETVSLGNILFFFSYVWDFKFFYIVNVCFLLVESIIGVILVFFSCYVWVFIYLMLCFRC